MPNIDKLEFVQSENRNAIFITLDSKPYSMGVDTNILPEGVLFPLNTIDMYIHKLKVEDGISEDQGNYIRNFVERLNY